MYTFICMCMYTHTNICMCMYIYIYMYIQREREIHICEYVRGWRNTVGNLIKFVWLEKAYHRPHAICI